MSGLWSSGWNLERAGPVRQMSYLLKRDWSRGLPTVYEIVVFSSTDCQRSSVVSLMGNGRVPSGEEGFSATSSIRTSRSTISTSLATCTAVNGLSPVIMTHYIRNRKRGFGTR